METFYTQNVCIAQAPEHRKFADSHTDRVLHSFVMDYRELAAKRLKEARAALRTERGKPLSQAGLAKLIPGCTAARIGNYESGIRYAPPDVFQALSEMVNEPAAYLAGLVDGKAAELLRAFSKLDDDDQDDVLHFVGRRKSLRFVEMKDDGFVSIEAKTPKPSIARKR